MDIPHTGVSAITVMSPQLDNMKSSTRTLRNRGSAPGLTRTLARGMTVVELLIVLTVFAIVAAIAIPNMRGILQGREDQAAIQSIQQTVWQGATAAAARGVVVTLTRTGNRFVLTNTETNAELKRFDMPSGVTSNWPQNSPLVFTPPGKVDLGSMADFPTSLTVTAKGKSTRLQISLIGEVRTVAP